MPKPLFVFWKLYMFKYNIGWIIINLRLKQAALDKYVRERCSLKVNFELK